MLTTTVRKTHSARTMILHFFKEVTEGKEYAPDAVITGHLHFLHEDVFPNGVPQYVTDIVSGGNCRLITLIPSDNKAE